MRPVLPAQDTLIVVCPQVRYLRPSERYPMENFVTALRARITKSLDVGDNIVFMEHTESCGFHGLIHPELRALTQGRSNILTIESLDHRINHRPLENVRIQGSNVRIAGMNATSMVLRVASHLLESGFTASIVLDSVINRYGDTRISPEQENDIARILAEYEEASLGAHVDTSGYDPTADRTLFDLHARLAAEYEGSMN